MDKKKIFVNLLLCVILLAIVAGGVIVYRKYEDQRRQEELENIQLIDIGYGSEVSQIGYENASAILNHFINAYNNSDGESLVAIMDLVSTYIYSEYGESEFDNKYVEILSNPSEYEDLIIMQTSLQQEEAALIQGMEENSVQLTLVDNSKIEDVCKYLSKMTAEIITVFEADGIDEIDMPTIIEGAPYLMDTRSIELGGNDGITTVKIYKIEAEFGNTSNTEKAVVIGQFIGEYSIDRFYKETIQPSYILDLEDLYG